MRITNQTKNTLIADRARLADTIVSRLVGLLSRASLSSQEGLVITECRQIHMLFMRFAIDVIFVNRDNKVVGLVRDIKPFRMSPYFFRAQKAIELPVGVIDSSRTEKGDTLFLKDEE
ncbi:MAG TPA: DUF192 domain-containing protein [Candidatus Omnitrophota bacterium]|nr:DUF192 domain-containing protein [Candidatus Omnitrophota bacterium]HPN55752.1 DUF192 domain-containing protein [Candidatus Omnitrophota bacterium]